MKALPRRAFVSPDLHPRGAAAQSFPDKPIRLIVPFPPGDPVGDL